MPILILSARAQERSKIEAFEAGADDYVTKPFGIGELLARIKRRAAARGPPAAGGAVLRFDACRRRPGAAHGDAGRRSLCTSRRSNSGCSRRWPGISAWWSPIASCWSRSGDRRHASDTHYLRIYMKQLRDKLEPDPLRPRHLVTEIGVGYRLECGD